MYASILLLLTFNFSIFLQVNKNNQVKINWTATCNNNTRYFSIERSDDAVNWQEIQRLFSSTPITCDLEFDYQDFSPGTGKQFYRVRQVDQDGLFVTSITASVQIKEPAFYTIGPNPAINQLLVGISTEGAVGKKYQIISMNGLKMREGNLVKEIQIGNLQAGIYWLRILNEKGALIQYQAFFKN